MRLCGEGFPGKCKCRRLLSVQEKKEPVYVELGLGGQDKEDRQRSRY